MSGDHDRLMTQAECLLAEARVLNESAAELLARSENRRQQAEAIIQTVKREVANV